MKRRLNILCVLVMLLLGYSVFEYAYISIAAAADGVEMGENLVKRQKQNSKMQAMKDAFALKPIALIPDNFAVYNDSVYNEKSGTYVPAMHIQMAIVLPTQSSIWLLMVNQLFLAFSIIPALLAIFLFVKLIISINKSDIFNWKNVYRLRWIGGSLVFCYLCIAIPVFITSYELSEVFALRGYSLHQSDLASVTTLVLGVASLIVAEVFAIGLRMKEEQDLTI